MFLFTPHCYLVWKFWSSSFTISKKETKHYSSIFSFVQVECLKLWFIYFSCMWVPGLCIMIIIGNRASELLIIMYDMHSKWYLSSWTSFLFFWFVLLFVSWQISQHHGWAFQVLIVYDKTCVHNFTYGIDYWPTTRIWH
jgi:hypothetical protein